MPDIEYKAENELGPLDFCLYLRSMDNDFQLIEAIIKSWIDYNEKFERTVSKQERETFTDRFCSLLDDIEKNVGLHLSSRKDFEELIRSDDVKSWRTIFYTDLPKLRSEILNAISGKLSALPDPLWSDVLPDTFAKQVLPLFRRGDYLSAVRRGCDVLRAVVRTKTGLHALDGIDLINLAYGKERPFSVAIWENHSEDNVRLGYADMLRGAMAAIRNVHYHGTEELTKMEAARLLVILGTLWARADGTTKIKGSAALPPVTPKAAGIATLRASTDQT